MRLKSTLRQSNILAAKESQPSDSEVVGDTDVIFDRDILGSPRRIDTQCRKASIVERALQGVAQHLPALRKSLLDYLSQLVQRLGIQLADGLGNQADHGGIDLRGRIEAFRRHIDQPLQPEAVLQHDRQTAEIGVTRLGHHALDDFLLQHEVHVVDRLGVVGEVEKQGGRNVVGQVADQTLPRADAGEVEGQRIALVDGHALPAMLLFQAGDQVTVAFDDVQVIDPLQQGLGDGAEAWADFDYRITTLWIDGRNDGTDDALVDQEVLAKSFAGDVAFHADFLCAMRAASLTASNKLPGSALPVPASSSAVPWSTEVRMMGRPSVTLMPLPKVAYLSAVRPWSWYMARTASPWARTGGVNMVSAGCGPDKAMPSPRSLSRTGAMTSISSRPR